MAQGTLTAELKRFLAWLATRNYSPFTIEQRESAIKAFIGWAALRGVERPQDVTRPILERYQRHLFHHRKADGAPLTFRTQAVRLSPLRAFFKWLARENLILFNPAADLELPRGEKRLPANVLAPEEVETVLAQPDISTPQGLRDRAILETLYSAAIRRLELVRLHVFDVDYARKLLVVRGKGNKDRIVPAGERALAWIDKYVEDVRPDFVSGADDGSLFLSVTGQAFKPNRVAEIARGYIVRAGIGKKGACHIFRHTMATLMLENGADIRFIQAILETTTYCSPTPDRGAHPLSVPSAVRRDCARSSAIRLSRRRVGCHSAAGRFDRLHACVDDGRGGGVSSALHGAATFS